MEKVKIELVLLNKDNPRLIRDDKFKKLVKSIEEFPEMLKIRPIVVDENMTALGGNMRLKACLELGMKEVYVIKANDLTEDQKKEFIIKDNVGFGEWDWDVLGSDWNIETLDDWGLETTGFITEDINDVIEKDNDFHIPELTDDEIKIKEGDVIEINANGLIHKLICGDSTKEESLIELMGSDLSDVIFTDPDYSMSIESVKECYFLLKKFSKNGFSFWVCADKQAVELAYNDFESFSHFFIHDFKVPTMKSSTQVMTAHNMICKFNNVKMTNLKDGFSTIVSIATERTLKTHKLTPMSKRIELPIEFISHYSKEGDIVMDAFVHSGSTLMACIIKKRVFRGLELLPKYCQVSINRVLNMYPDSVIKINGEVYNG